MPPSDSQHPPQLAAIEERYANHDTSKQQSKTHNNISLPQKPLPHKKKSTKKRKHIFIVAMVLICIILVLLTEVIGLFLMPPRGPIEERYADKPDIEVIATATGVDWAITVISGEVLSDDVHLLIINSTTLWPTINKPVNSLGTSDPDATYYNNNNNNKLDPGDIIFLKGDGGRTRQGDQMWLLCHTFATAHISLP